MGEGQNTVCKWDRGQTPVRFLTTFTKSSQKILALTIDERQFKCYITYRTKEEEKVRRMKFLI